MDFGTLFKSILTTEAVGTTVHSLIRNSMGHKRTVLLELQENMDLLLLARGGELPLHRAIEKLERKYYIAAVESGFNLNSIKGGGLKERTTKQIPQFRKYTGWSTERLFENVYRKVKQLKDIAEIDSEKKKVNIRARAGNLLKMMALLLNHIKK